MIELATTIAALLQPFAVPLMVAICFGVWKIDRRVIRLQTLIGGRNEKDNFKPAS